MNKIYCATEKNRILDDKHKTRFCVAVHNFYISNHCAEDYYNNKLRR